MSDEHMTTEEIADALGVSLPPAKITVQERLAAIEGLELADCLKYFDEKDLRAVQIVDLCEVEDEGFEIDTAHTSEGDDNGAYVLGWRWVSFENTDLDKNKEEDEE